MLRKTMPQDFILTEELDLAIADGDFVVGESTLQHQLLLLKLNKGDLKEHPLACVGVARYLKDEDFGGLTGEVKRECENDGMNVTKVELDADGKLTLEALYDY